MITHELIMQAFKAMLIDNLPQFNLISRRFQLFENCTGQLPALLIVEPADQVVQDLEGLPALRTFEVELYLYMDVGSDPNVEPISDLNNLIEAVGTAFRPDLPLPFDQVCTLGGLVQHCWIEGTIEKSPGDLDGQGIARIPVRISIP